MKKLNTILVLALLVCSVGTTALVAATKMHNTETEEKNVGSFKGIASGGPIAVMVTMGNTESVRIEGDEDALADLITEVKEGVLIIRPKTKWGEWSRKYRKPQVTVFIKAKKINSLTMSGSGSIEVANSINSSDLVVTLNGSGSITASATVKTFRGDVNRSGTLKMSGKSINSNLTLSGSGNFEGKKFTATELSVQISGSANAYIKVTTNIDAVISGSGNVLYSGNPSVKKTIIGSGNVSKW